MNTIQHQQTTLNIQEDYLELAIQSFLMAKQSENLTKGSVKFYKDKLDLFLKFCEGQQIKTISQITPSAIREFLLFWQANHKAGGAHGIYRSLKAFLRWYWDEVEPTYPNPIAKIKAPKVDLEPLEPADIDDVERMIAACPNDTLAGRRDKALMYFFADSGCRANEALRIQLDQINILTGEVLIAKSKSRKPRTIFLGEKSRRAIRRYLKLRRDNCPALWVTVDGHPLSYWGMVTAFKERAKKAGVKPPSIHSFRRFWALEMLRNNVDLISLSRLGGWGDLQVITRYTKQRKDDLKAKYNSPIDDHRPNR